MNVSDICHYNLRASRDLLESLREFYTGIVGLCVGSRPPFRNFGYWLYAGGKDVLHLTEGGAGEAHAAGAGGTFDHVAFACSGPAEYEACLRSHGVAYQSDTVARIGQYQLFFRDPAGSGVELNLSAVGACGPNAALAGFRGPPR